jgi:phosphate transport system protein
MARDAFQAELDVLQADVRGVGTRVRRATDESMRALRDADQDASRRLIEANAAILRERWSVEERAISAVAEQQPVATDCRRLMGFLSVLGDLARIGDHARGIAEINLLMGESAGPRRLGYLPSMADKALAMLDDSLRAFAEDDVLRARHVLVADDDLDRLQERIYSDVFRAMIEAPERIQEQTHLLWVGHNLERVGDRCTNVCESVLFTVTGNRDDVGVTKRPAPPEA